jgi:hypothetical protein
MLSSSYTYHNAGGNTATSTSLNILNILAVKAAKDFALEVNVQK